MNSDIPTSNIVTCRQCNYILYTCQLSSYALEKDYFQEMEEKHCTTVNQIK